MLALCLATIIGVYAQDVGGSTKVSQSRTTIANIGQADITIKYHSPSVNGRKIFGGIVPYDFVVDGVEYPWRAGANQRTTIEFSHDVQIEGQPLKAGVYGFVALVSEEEWTLIFSSGTTWGAFNYDKSNDALRVQVKTRQLPHQEWLSYEFLNPRAEAVEVQLRWETTAVSFEVATNALDNILVNVAANDDKAANDYLELAKRTLERDPSLKEEALKYLELANEKMPEIENEAIRQGMTFNYQVMKGEVLISLGKKKEGQALIDLAMSEAENFNLYYYALNKFLVEGEKESAFEILQKGTELYPDNHANYLALGEYYLKEGDQAQATEHFKMAYERAVKNNPPANYYRYMYLQNKLILDREQGGN